MKEQAIAAGEKLAVMPKKKYIVTLTHPERTLLEQLTTKGKAAAYKVNHARILLLADTNREEGGGWKDRDISEALNISISTIERVRQRLVESGVEEAKKPKSPKEPTAAAFGRKTRGSSYCPHL